jgi:GGDEF domain-containing protein
MLIALVVVALGLAALAVVAAIRARRDAARQRAALERLGEQLAPISERIRDSVARALPPDEPRLDVEPKLEELLERIAADRSAVVAFRQLASELTPEAASARRSTPRGSHAYEDELEREIARARRTGRPLSLVLIDVDQPTADRLLQLAALLTRVTRVTDTICRRRRDAFGILLPETAAAGADRFLGRVREEAALALASDTQTTFSTGIVEWRADETSDALDARARAALESRAGSHFARPGSP